jgi:tetratricopeptide (TPR) repeat protein
MLVIGVYAYTAHPGFLASTSLNAAETYYNLLVQGFRVGQLNLKKEVPPGLAQLADPYDRTANKQYGVLDLSYYKGKFYLYFGATPAVVLFWPYVALTGHYLSQKDAGVIFCMIGFLASVGLLCALWRRYFAEASVGLVAACAVALGLATGVPVILSRCDVYEVAISCGYAFTMLALVAMWKALHEPERRGWWLAAASLAYGLAVGARPSLLFGAAMLLVPVAQAWHERFSARLQHERRKVWALLLAATGPIIVIGLGLMLYNALRFDNPLEFGLRYQLSGQRQVTLRFFSLDYLWFNFRVYFLEPARWGAHFPFVHKIAMPHPPPGHGGEEAPFGVLTNIPLVWLALAVPLAWRDRPGQAGSTLRWFVTAVAVLFGICTVTLGVICGANFRYEVEFLPTLVLLAAIGILSLERALTPTLASNRIRGQESGRACRPVWRRAVRWGWGLLLGFSVAFNLLVSVEHCAEAHYYLGSVLSVQGKVPEAKAHYEQALRFNPDYAEPHYNLGVLLKDQGHVPEAMAHYEQALRINPDYAEAHCNLGVALQQVGQVPEAMAHYKQALRLKPDFAEAHYNLGGTLQQAGQVPEAIAHYEQALRIKPAYAEAHNNLGAALIGVGRVQEAIPHCEQALRIKPTYAEAHNNLGAALIGVGRVQEAIPHCEQALRIKPTYAEAHNNLGAALIRVGRVQEAIPHFEQALRIAPDRADLHYNLGITLQQVGQVPEAIAHYEQALRIKPDYAEAHHNLGNALREVGRVQEAIGHFEQALRIKPDYAEAKTNLATARATQERGVPSRR